MKLIADIFGDVCAKARWVYGDDSRASILRACLTDGTTAMVFYRLMQASRRCRLMPLEMLFNKINSAICHCVIGRGAEFGSEFVIVHSGGIVINGDVCGGNRIVLEHQVTLGAERRESPTLGNDIFVGAGAKILGGVKIGDRTRVGANAVVLHDVPSDHTAVGVPARMIDRTSHTRAAA